jgi:hypothetical protein
MATDQEAWCPLFVGSVIGGSNSKNRAIRAAVLHPGCHSAHMLPPAGLGRWPADGIFLTCVSA